MITPAGGPGDVQEQAAVSILAKVLSTSRSQAERVLQSGVTIDEVLTQAGAAQQAVDAASRVQGLHVDTTA